MTEKEKAEMMNLRRRVEAQREEIKALRRTIAEMKETGVRAAEDVGPYGRNGGVNGQTGD